MRYKRVNTLALDASSMPTCPRISTIKKIIESFKLDTTKLKSVQFLYSKRIIYVGLPDGESAADIATEKAECTIKHNGSSYPVKITLADEDIVDVRIQHVPPETPNPIIEETLRKYGKVLSLKSEKWADYFPGALTGVRVARMKPSQNIPSFLSIGNAQALVTYTGQIKTCRRCNLPVHQNRCTSSPQKTPQQQDGSKELPHGGNTKPQQEQNAQNDNTQQKQIDSTPGASLSNENGNAETLEEQDNVGFTIVQRRKRRNAIDRRIDGSSGESDVEQLMEDEDLKKLSEAHAFLHGPANFQRWLELQGAFKKVKS